MGRIRERGPGRGRRTATRVLHAVPVLLVLALLGSAVAAYRFDVGRLWFGFEDPDPRTDPVAVAPPPGLTLPLLTPPAPVLPTATQVAGPGGGLSATRLRLALARGLLDRDLGRHVVAAVAPLDRGRPVFSSGTGPVIPASTMKLLTATAALEVLGPDTRFVTRVVSDRGGVVLMGGGDPLLASRPAAPGSTYPARADVTTLAAETARALREAGVRRVRVGYDDSLFTGPTVSPRWRPNYIPDGVVAPVTALWVDEGRPASGYGRVADPSASATDVFAAALRARGIRVLGPPTAVTAPPRARELARVESAPLDQIVQRVLEVSDNEAAEVLAHQVGLATVGEGSFAGGARGVLQAMRWLGVPTAGARVYDGSGLSRQDRLSAATLLAVLRVAAAPDRPELRPVVSGLPVAGFTGSLAYRFDTGEAQGRGRVRAKTGTLTGVHGLAGVAIDLDGNPMVFMMVADRVRGPDNLDARETLDRLAAELGACRCSA